MRVASLSSSSLPDSALPHSIEPSTAERARNWAFRSPVGQAGALALAFLLVLQLWQPYFFLNDDNMSGWLPVTVAAARRLWSGQALFVDPWLYGGGYQLLRDPAALCLWNPLNLVLAVLAHPALENTHAVWAMVDLYVSFNLLVCALAFAALLLRLREKYELPLSSRRIVFLSFSWTFSSFAIIVNASWMTFSANQAALAMMALGWFHHHTSRGVAWCAAGILYGLLIGHLSPLLWSIAFGTLFVLGLWRLDHSPEAFKRWIGGGCVAAILVAPILWPALQGFLGTSRSGGMSSHDTAKLSVPLPVLLLSFPFGSMSIVGGLFSIVGLKIGLGYAIASCAAAWSVLHSWRAPRRHGVEVLCLAMIVPLALLIARPAWLTEIVSQIPLLRALRFPFREVYLWLFWIHLWIALRPVTLKRPAVLATTSIGVVIWAASLFSFGPPSFTRMSLDRHLLLSGKADAHWERLRHEFPRGTRFVPAMSPRLMSGAWREYPFSLVGAFNYPALFEVPSQSGYAILALSIAREKELLVPGPSGIYRPEVARQMMRHNPHLKVLHLASLEPPRLELWEHRGGAIQSRPIALPPIPSFPVITIAPEFRGAAASTPSAFSRPESATPISPTPLLSTPEGKPSR
ncbi:MAG: hypothetical protein JWN98_231 [Abditibacteriota bacterium]|nr:hypothetical protein [Abditibacteriota bacterium]